MLGSLARWLRLFGFDTLYFEPGPPDHELAEQARTDGRWLLTRDRELAAVGPRTMLVRSTGLEEQLAEVFSRLGLRPTASLDRARCGECNGELEETPRSTVADEAPPYVMATSARFKRCRGCAKVYWPGTHGRGILERMKEVVSLVANSPVVSDH
jgi:uncharacterized protein with PIN domain